MFSICEYHCPVLLKVTPRCLWLSMKSIGILSKISCGKILIFLRVHKTASVFSGLNVTSHCLAQFDNNCISWLIIPACCRIEKGTIICKQPCQTKKMFSYIIYVYILARHNQRFCIYVSIKMRFTETQNVKVSKCAKIRNRYNQVPHLAQDTNGKVTNSQ